MWTATQINKVALSIDGGTRSFADLVIHDFNLEWVVCKHATQCCVIVFFPLHLEIGFDQFLHALLNRSEVLICERIHVKIVVESIFDWRPNGWLCVGIKLDDGLGQQMCA